MQQWRDDGFSANDVELWAVGYHSTVGQASIFADGNPAPCLADGAEAEGSAFDAYGAEIDDLFILDRQGQVRFALSVAVRDLEKPSNRDAVDAWVRELL